MPVTLELHTLVLSLSLLFALALALVLYVKLLLHEIPQGPPHAGEPLAHDVMRVPRRSSAPTRSATEVFDDEEPEAEPTISRTFSKSVISRHSQHQGGTGQETSMTGRKTGLQPSSSQSFVSSMIRPSTPPSRATTPRPTPSPSFVPSSSVAARPSRSPIPGPSDFSGSIAASVSARGSISQASLRPTGSSFASSRATSLAPSDSSQLSSLSPSPRSSPAPLVPPSTPSTTAASSSSSPLTVLSAASTMYDDDSDGAGFEYRRRHKEHTARNGVVTRTYYFKSEGPELRTCAPDPSQCEYPQLEDVFMHTAKGVNKKEFQFWIWATNAVGVACWKPAALGYARADGKRLNLSFQHKELGWVTEKHFKRVQKQELEQAELAQAGPSTKKLRTTPRSK